MSVPYQVWCTLNVAKGSIQYIKEYSVEKIMYDCPRIYITIHYWGPAIHNQSIMIVNNLNEVVITLKTTLTDAAGKVKICNHSCFIKDSCHKKCHILSTHCTVHTYMCVHVILWVHCIQIA